MVHVVWRRAAIDDLETIYDYIAHDNPVRAASFADELSAKISLLSETPYVGEARLPNLPNIRIFPYKNYLFLYEPIDNPKGIELLRIIHTAQDYLNKDF